MSVPENASLVQMLESLKRGNGTDMPIVDEADMVTGMLRVAALDHLSKRDIDAGVGIIAADLAVSAEVALPEDLLLTAIQKMERSGVNCLAVIEPESGRLQGLVRRQAILDFYEQSIKSA